MVAEAMGLARSTYKRCQIAAQFNRRSKEWLTAEPTEEFAHPRAVRRNKNAVYVRH